MEIDPDLDRDEVIAYKEGRCHRVGPAVARALRQVRDIIWKEVARRGWERGERNPSQAQQNHLRAARNQMKRVTLSSPAADSCQTHTKRAYAISIVLSSDREPRHNQC